MIKCKIRFVKYDLNPKMLGVYITYMYCLIPNFLIYIINNPTNYLLVNWSLFTLSLSKWSFLLGPKQNQINLLFLFSGAAGLGLGLRLGELIILPSGY